MRFPITRGPAQESRHNLIYWRYGDYAGVGPGAHGRLELNGNASPRRRSDCRNAGAMRSRKTGHGFAEMTPVPDAEAAREHLLMNLRLAEGLDLAAYEKRWNTQPDAAKIAALVEQGLLSQTGRIA